MVADMVKSKEVGKCDLFQISFPLYLIILFDSIPIRKIMTIKYSNLPGNMVGPNTLKDMVLKMQCVGMKKL